MKENLNLQDWLMWQGFFLFTITLMLVLSKLIFKKSFWPFLVGFGITLMIQYFFLFGGK